MKFFYSCQREAPGSLSGKEFRYSRRETLRTGAGKQLKGLGFGYPFITSSDIDNILVKARRDYVGDFIYFRLVYQRKQSKILEYSFTSPAAEFIKLPVPIDPIV